MRFDKRQWIALVLVGVGLGLIMFSLTGCDSNSKAVQQYNDAPTPSNNDDTPARILNMPDGFSNVAFKCVKGDGVYVIFHKDSAYGSLAVVGNDRACA